jgi:hypothetical protein
MSALEHTTIVDIARRVLAQGAAGRPSPAPQSGTGVLAALDPLGSRRSRLIGSESALSLP